MPQELRLTRISNRSSTPSISTRSADPMQEMKYSWRQYRRIKYCIKNFRLQKSTQKSYKKTWDRFNRFISRFDIIPPKWEDRIIVWATHLADNRKKSATIRSYISAVRYCLSLDGIVVPHSNCELAAIVQAARRENDTLYIRLPIQRQLMKLILNFIRQHYSKARGQRYQALWLMAAFSLAYHGMMRISELTDGPHNLKAMDVVYAKNKGKITLYLRSSKTHTCADLPQIINIQALPNWNDNCPVKLINEYADTRGRSSLNQWQPFLIHKDGMPISQEQFRTNLKYILDTLGLPSALYGSHSFRSGKATDDKLAGKRVKTIKQEGRWTSSTVWKYIRTGGQR